MTALKFPTEKAFVTVIAAGLVPADVLRREVAFARATTTRGGRHKTSLVVDCSAVPEADVDALVRAGAERVTLPAVVERAPFWPAVIRPVTSPERDRDRRGVLVFKTPLPESGLELAGALVELGAERIEIATFQGTRLGDDTSTAEQGSLVLAAGASEFHVARAVEHDRGLAVFERASSRDGVYIELGYRNPCLGALVPAPGHAIFVYGDGRVEQVTHNAFSAADMSIELVVEQQPFEPPNAQMHKLSVPLRLVRAARDRPASLWVFREGGLALLDRLVSDASDRTLASLTFAVAGAAASPVVVIRAHAGATDLPVFEGEAHAAITELGDVYVPVDRVVHPPVSAHRLRHAVGGPDDLVRWLAPREGRVVVESLPLRAFEPILEWVELCAGKADLEPWVRNVSFEPQAFVAADVSDEPAAPSRRRTPPELAIPRAVETTTKSAPPKPARIARVATAPAAAQSITASSVALAPAAASLLDERLDTAERAIAATDFPLSDPRRDADWVALGRAYHDSGLFADARICFARAAAAESESAREAKELFLRLCLDRAGVASQDAWARAVATDDRNEGSFELLLALLLAGDAGSPMPPDGAIERATAVVDRHEAELDVRSAWLARLALGRLSGGDQLAVARAKDTTLGRLERGLSIGRDLPRVVRALGVAHASERRRALSQILTHFETTPRTKHPLEAASAATPIYVRLVFACAFARVGDAARARELASAALEALPRDDRIHALLGRSFAARVDQALDGDIEDTPLSPTFAAAYEELTKAERFKVDRVRQASKLLEPDPDLDAFGRYRAAEDRSIALFASKVAHAALPSEAGRLLDDAIAEGEVEVDPARRRARFEAIVNAMGCAPRRVALSRIDAIVKVALGLEGVDRVRAIAVATAITARLDRHDVAVLLLARVGAEIARLPPDVVATVVPAVVQGIASVAHRGAAEEVERLLLAIQTRLGTQRDVPARIARLCVLRARSSQNLPGEVGDVIESELRALDGGDLTPAERLALARSVASCAAASARLDDVRHVALLWRRMTDSYHTSSHLCLSAVELADAVAWSIVPRRGDTDARARRLADADEEAVRALVFG